MNAQEFGSYLKGLRKRQGLTLKKLEELTGYSNSYLSQIETGKKGIPSPEILKKLESPLGEKYSQLMFRAGYFEWMYDEEADPMYDTQDLGFVLHQKRVLYGDIELTDQDKKLITLYINALVSERTKKA
ncbi:helix-turn-helix domain-containing protein [Bacillus suaedae]|uniref:Helix-turn-helix domain-containing protein n=1 Tax=Halalkalibacter suaedae TaxID=2822140 RepID=A0A941AU36_9BACI|nr:helix-turn-helix transcriptional regulator [Bacillus suaedae]MBP3953624.1 helix-turn-helix domain-containing protein [Bacillus suaedae]